MEPGIASDGQPYGPRRPRAAEPFTAEEIAAAHKALGIDPSDG